MGTISDVLYCARDWIGYSRWTDPEEGTVFGRWFAEKTGEPYFGVSGVPYCAMFTSYCLDWAGVPCAGMPSASYSSWLREYEMDTIFAPLFFTASIAALTPSWYRFSMVESHSQASSGGSL